MKIDFNARKGLTLSVLILVSFIAVYNLGFYASEPFTENQIQEDLNSFCKKAMPNGAYAYDARLQDERVWTFEFNCENSTSVETYEIEIKP